MSLYYFVGGPTEGNEHEFFRRLAELGGPPAGWKIYPHARPDGKALHVAPATSAGEIAEHLRHFADIYEHGDITEIVDRG